MLAKSDASQPNTRLEKVGRAFRFFGLIGLAVQGILAFIATVSLLFAASGRSFSADSNSANSVGIFWAIAGLLALGVGLVLTFRFTLVGRALLHDPRVDYQPRKSDAIRLLKLGILVGFVGILIGLLGGGTSAGLMLSKTVSQPPGVAITDPDKIVRALDVLVLLASLNLIAAHFAGALTSIWLLDRTHHYEKKPLV